MPKLFPLIDALPNWVIYAVLTIWIALVAWGTYEFLRVSFTVIRYEWKYWRHRRREAAIASERMQAQAERWRR